MISTMPRHHSSFCKATVQLPLEKVCPRRSATMANVGQPVWNCTSAWSSREATTRFLMVSLSKSSACQSNHLPSYHLCLVALRARSSLAYDSTRLEDDNGRLIIVNTDGRERLSVHTHSWTTLWYRKTCSTQFLIHKKCKRTCFIYSHQIEHVFLMIINSTIFLSSAHLHSLIIFRVAFASFGTLSLQISDITYPVVTS